MTLWVVLLPLHENDYLFSFRRDKLSRKGVQVCRKLRKQVNYRTIKKKFNSHSFLFVSGFSIKGRVVFTLHRTIGWNVYFSQLAKTKITIMKYRYLFGVSWQQHAFHWEKKRQWYYCPRRDFAQKAKSRGGTLVTRAKIKESTYSWNIQSYSQYKKNLDLLEQGPRGIGR